MPSELATERRLIFRNLINGVPVEQVAQTFHRQTEKEVMDDFDFVALKIKTYLFQRAIPTIPCANLSEGRQNRLLLLGILAKVNLDIVPPFSKIEVKPVECIL